MSTEKKALAVGIVGTGVMLGALALMLLLASFGVWPPQWLGRLVVFGLITMFVGMVLGLVLDWRRQT